MSLSYGAADQTPTRASMDAPFAESESSALLGADGLPVTKLSDGPASMISSVGNLTNTIIGSGASEVHSYLRTRD
jgi:hypothetical protein